MNWSINLPKVCDPRDQAWLRFCLILSEMKRSINLPKVCVSRDQAWLRFYLILKQIVELMTCDIINLNVVNKAFINNNTFLGYLHSRGVVRHFPLNLQDNMHLPQPQIWYDMALPSWVPIFPMLGSLHYPKPFSILSLQMLVALTSRWHHTLTWACVDNRLIGPWHFLFVLQSSLNSSPITLHWHSEWKNSFLVLGI